MRYLEDFTAGQKFGGPERVRVDAARIKSFAAEFDPQAFHLDDAAARASIFRGLAASGWHTAAMTMRLLIRGNTDSCGVLADGRFISTRRSDSPSERGGGFWSSRELSSERTLLD